MRVAVETIRMGRRRIRKEVSSRPVDGFQVDNIVEPAKNERVCRVFGAPMHTTRNKALIRYTQRDLTDFLAYEGRHSLGNYVLLETGPNFCRIVTSPGYCGGYYFAKDGQFAAATLLSDVLEPIPGPVEMDSFGVCFFLSHAPQSNFNQMPFTTMFKGVFRLPPGAVLEFRDGELVANYSYLTLPTRAKPPKSFETAMREVSKKLGDYYERIGATSVGLMFSGGVDSLILYLALRRSFDAEKIRCFTVEHSKSNGPDRALPIAEKLGIELEIIPETAWSNEEVLSATLGMMRKDLLGTRSPHLALLGQGLIDIDLLHGQNMDALANIHMEILQSNLELGILSKSKVKANLSQEGENRQYASFIGNLQFTDTYLEDEAFQRMTVDFYAKRNAPAVPDPHPGKDGLIRGMISHQYPNLLSRADYPPDHMEYLNREVELLRDHIGRDQSPRMALDMARYLTYCHLSGKRIASFPVGHEDTRVVLGSMCGPLLSYYLGKSRTMRDASMPKREIYGLTGKWAGQSYRKLAAGRGENVRLQRDLSSMMKMIDLHKDMLNPATSRVLAAIPDKASHAYVRKVYEDISAAGLGERLTNFQIGQGIKLLNLELILSTAVQDKSGRK